MYWEDVYSMYEYASNLDSLELNEQMKFQFMLHAQSKEAVSGWRDMPIPFPIKGTKRYKRKDMLPVSMEKMKNSSIMNDEQKTRMEIVKEKMKQHEEKMDKMKRDYY